MIMVSWGDLNKRQQTYLKAIFEVDQAQEAVIKAASESERWIPYNQEGATLRHTITASDHDDQGSGATFAALERRGLVIIKYETDGSGTLILFVQITQAGCEVVRDAQSQKTPKPLLGRTLQARHWRALMKAYTAGDEGIRPDGHITWNTTWRVLRNYRVNGKVRPLVEEGKISAQPRRAFESYSASQAIRIYITVFGKQFYRDNWQRYRDLYPDVDAPHPNLLTKQQALEE